MINPSGGGGGGGTGHTYLFIYLNYIKYVIGTNNNTFWQKIQYCWETETCRINKNKQNSGAGQKGPDLEFGYDPALTDLNFCLKKYGYSHH